jgi:hypothetical protein
MDLSQLDLVVKVEPDASLQKIDEVNQTGSGEMLLPAVKGRVVQHRVVTKANLTRKAIEKNLREGQPRKESLLRQCSERKDLVKPVKILISVADS